MSEQNQIKEFHDEFKRSRLPENVEAGAQVNVIESISLDGVQQPITGKNVNLTIDLSDYAKMSDLNILSTTPSTIDGGIWFGFENHYPVLKILHGGEELTFIGTSKYLNTQSGGQSEGTGTYYFSLSGVNLIENYKPDEFVSLEEGLELTDGVFVERGEFKDLALTFGDNTTATIRTTTASALESLDTQGRTILFIDQNERRSRTTFYDDGRIVCGNAITLSSDFADSAFAAGDFTSVTSNHSPISIQGGTLPSMLKGGSGNDTLVGNSGNDTFTGGTGGTGGQGGTGGHLVHGGKLHGHDLFVVKLVGDNVITDFDAGDDRISLVGGDMEQLQGMSSTNDGLKLEFGSGTLMLADFENGTITVNGETHIVEGTTLFNEDRTAATFFAPADVDLDDTIYAGVSTLNAKCGGDIRAGSSGVVMSGTSAFLVGGDGNDTFLFAGGDITVANYASGDCISLAQGYTLEDYKLYSGIYQCRLTIRDTLDNEGYIVVDGVGKNSTIDLYDASGTKSTLNFVPEENIVFNKTNPAKAKVASVLSAYGDLSKQNEDRTEVYADLQLIIATQDNSTLIGNSNNISIVIKGGSDNVLTGGLGNDGYAFIDGGGIITDFGIGATLAGLATSPSANTYDITDPTTYAHGVDGVEVKGTVNGIYFDSDVDANEDALFIVVISYNYRGENQIVVLNNIIKKAQAGGYQTNYEAAKALRIKDSTNRRSALTVAKLSSFFHDARELTAEQLSQVYHLLSISHS